MAILKIARMGHPVLGIRAREVDDPTAPQIRGLVADMLETMKDADGAGLAAPQVHVPLRIVLFYVSRTRAERDDPPEDAPPEDAPPENAMEVPLTVLINPEIEVMGEEMALGWEGCLSVPDLMGQVPRHKSIRYRALSLKGEMIEREAQGFHARVVQHECDHLDGVLYPQRMTDLSRLVFTSELRHRAMDDEDEEI